MMKIAGSPGEGVRAAIGLTNYILRRCRVSASNRKRDSRTVGDIRVTALDAGRFRLDGGTMFGVVPRSIWEKKIPPDGRNRIQLGLNCLLVETPTETVLVETGIGAAKLSPKYRDVYGADPSRGVIDALTEAGVAPEAVDRVVLTHLHMDHAGGTTVRTDDGYVPAFPNARYVIQRQEWEDALGADRQTVRGYNAAPDLVPLERAGVLELVEGDAEVCPGVRTILTPGHTRAHQSVLIHSGGETVCFIGDLVPTRHHVHPVYIMAFDLYPRQTFKVRQRVLKRAAGEGWLMAWPHDPEQVWAYITIDDSGEFIPVEEL